MKKLILATVMVALTSTLAFGKAPIIGKKDVAKCATILADLNRLTCFDMMAKKFGVDKPKSTASKAGKWSITNSVSPVDDSKTVVLRLEADTEIRGWLSAHKPSLIIRCQENKTSAYIVTGMQPRGEYPSDYITGTFRFDKKKAGTLKMLKSTDSKALFFNNEIGVIKRMAKHQKMLFQFTPFNSSPTMTTFQISGLAKALKPLRKVCGW